MSLARTLAVLPAICALACDTNLQREAQNQLRSESSVISLPTKPAELASLLSTSPDSLRAAGEERYRNQSFDSARAIWQVELQRALTARDAKGEARVRMWLGIVAWKLGDLQTARKEAEASIALKQKLRMDDELSRSFNSLGLIAWHQSRYRDALASYDSAIAAAKRHNDLKGIARAAANIPLVKVELGAFDAARVDFDRAVAANSKAGDTRTQGNLLANLGMLEVRLGNPSRALRFLEQARAHYGPEEVSGQANALGQIATAYGALGDLQRAISAADSAITIAGAEGLQQELAANLEVMADLEMQSGNPRLALARLRTADSLDAALGLRVERGTNLRRSAIILTDLGETAPATALARNAISEHRAVDATNEVVLDRLQLAEVQSLMRRRGAARAQVDSARIESAKLGNPVTDREVILTSARLFLEAGEPKSALDELDRRTRSTVVPDWRLFDLRATALLAMGRVTDARKQGEHAVALIETERASLGSGPLRAGYLANRTLPFSHLVAIDLAEGDTAAAFEVAASLSGRTIVERLGGLENVSAQVASVAEGERLLVRASELERQIADVESDNSSGDQLEALNRELLRTRSQYESQLSERAPVPRAGVLGVAKVSARGIQSRLAADQALLTYISGPEQLDIFVARRDRIAHRSVSIGDRELARRVRLARAALQRSADRKRSISVLGDLYDAVLGTADPDLSGVDRLVIVPHASLGALPFAALWHKSTGKFLIEERTISYLPSAAALGASTLRTRSARLTLFAPTPDELPGTMRESKAISRLVPGSHLNAGSRSTEAGIRSALVRGDMVHVAAHGTHNAQNPLFSRMTVGKKMSGVPERDGRLEVHEIMGIRVASPLVFLSGCETALGSSGDSPFTAGSEEGSLSQAFLFAGASTVVATLWEVRDAEAATIAASFYRELGRGASPARALAWAQREAASHRSGFTWAAYAVSGGS